MSMFWRLVGRDLREAWSGGGAAMPVGFFLLVGRLVTVPGTANPINSRLQLSHNRL